MAMPLRSARRAGIILQSTCHTKRVAGFVSSDFRFQHILVENFPPRVTRRTDKRHGRSLAAGRRTSALLRPAGPAAVASPWCSPSRSVWPWPLRLHPCAQAVAPPYVSRTKQDAIANECSHPWQPSMRPQGLCGAAFNRMRGPPRADRGVRVPGPSDGRCRGRPCIASSAACFWCVLFLISFTVHRLQPSVHYLTSHVTHDTARGERSRCRRAVT